MTATAPISRPLRAADPRLAPWRAFVLAHARVWRRLDEDLRLEHALSLPEYETLLLLAESEGRRLRMRVLAEDLQLSKSGVTRLVDRLVDDGLVERGQCTTDARGAEAVLTEAGLSRLRSAAPTHLRGIQAYFLDAIESPDLAVVERAMRAVGGALSGGLAGRPGRSARPLECAPSETAAPATDRA
jgi:DNA-binding MarR family transcriptional regulator